MPDQWRRAHALGGAGPAEIVGRSVSLRERAGAAITRLEGPRTGPALAGFLAALRLAELPPVGASAGDERALLLCPGPRLWLLLSEARSAATDAFEHVLDLSSAWVRIGVTGADAGWLLAKGCALDLHPRSFPPGACTFAGFAGMRVLVRRPVAETGFELWTGRSYALSLWDWLIQATAERGCVGGRVKSAPAGASIQSEEE